MGKREWVSNTVTIEKVKSWKNGDIITISAGTGAGKSYFIKNNLYALAKDKFNGKILFLIHRINCVDQFQQEIVEDKKTDTIDIMTYQKIENELKQGNSFHFYQYKYIVCDEFHYFLSDAAFNKTTDMSLNAILAQKDKIRIFMSATGDYMRKYINNIKKLETIDYEIPINYNFIKTLTFFHKRNTIERLIDEAIEDNKKTIVFMDSAEKAYKLHQKYKDYSLFNCSKYNDDYYKYVEAEVIQTMLKEKKFEKLILITTTTMDAGVSIEDNELEHIICDVKDTGTLIQCIGRKRLLHKDDGIYLYVKSIHNKQLGGLISQTNKRIEKAKYLKERGEIEYIKKYSRDSDYYNIVYDEIVPIDQYVKRFNDLAYYKNLITAMEYRFMLDHGKFGYCDYIADIFKYVDKYDRKYRTIEEYDAFEELEMYLESIVGKVMLTRDDRKELIEKINVKQNGRLLRSLNSINSALCEQNFNYTIKQFETSRMIDGKKKKFKSAWKVLRLSEK